MRTGTPIRIILHSPQSEADKKELARRVAELHADCVLSTIRGLDCSLEQKRELLQAVINAGKECFFKQKSEHPAGCSSAEQ